jgi:O-antigen/teichoic acid export membrane protein
MLKDLIEIIKKPFIKNVTIVAGGTGMAQIIVMAFSPIITRLYGPEAFGILGVFTASSAILITIGSLTYQIAIVLPKKDDDAKAIVVLSLIIAAIFSSVLAIVLILFRKPIISLLHLEAISSYILVIPVFIFFSACSNIAEQWIIRTGQFKKKARVGIVQALIISSTKSGIGLWYPAAVVLVSLTTLGHMLYAFMLSWTRSIKKQTFFKLKNAPWLTISQIKEVALRHRDFPLYRAPQALLGTITKQLPLIFIASFFGPVYAGFYTLGQRVIKNPSNLISDAVGKVFYPWISRSFNEGRNIRHIIIRITLGLGGIGIIPFGIIAILGPQIIGFIFGSEWVAAGEYARWLTIWIFFDFIRVPSSHAIPVIGIQGFFLIYTVISTVIRLSTIFIMAIITQNDILTVASYCVVSSLMSLVLIFVTIVKCNNK